MVFLNSLKILFNNFSLVYKVLLYKLIAILIAVSVVFSFAYPSLSQVYNAGAFVDFPKIFGTHGFNATTSATKVAISTFLNVFNTIDTKTKTLFIVGVILLFVLVLFLFNLDKIAQSEVIYAKLSSNYKISYSGSLFKRFGYSVLFALEKTFYDLLFLSLIVYVFAWSLNLLDISGFVGIISPFLIFLILTILIAFTITILGCHASACVVNQECVTKSFVKSIAVTFKKFFRTFGMNLLLIVCIVFVNYVFGTILAGVFLLITVPASLVWISCFEEVMYFTNTGNKYYVDAKTIVAPNKNEFYDKVKNIIDII